MTRPPWPSRRRLLGAAAAGGALALLVPPCRAAADPPPILFGSLVPLTEDGGPDGPDIATAQRAVGGARRRHRRLQDAVTDWFGVHL